MIDSDCPGVASEWLGNTFDYEHIIVIAITSQLDVIFKVVLPKVAVNPKSASLTKYSP